MHAVRVGSTLRLNQISRVTDLQPVDTAEDPYFFTFKVQCTSCREVHPNWINVSRFVRSIFDSIYSFGDWSRSPMIFQVVKARQILFGDASPARSVHPQRGV